MTGEDEEIKSFTSDKNENIKAVQFVIKTPAIEKAEVEKKEVKEQKEENFWDKLLKLFGID